MAVSARSGPVLRVQVLSGNVPERSGRSVTCVGEMQLAAGLAPVQADFKARRFRLASPATVLGALVLVLNAIAVPLGGLTGLRRADPWYLSTIDGTICPWR